MDLEKHVTDLVVEGFPELQNIFLYPEFKKKANFYAEFGRNGSHSYDIGVSSKLRKAPSNVSRGCLAHELVHTVYEVQNSRLHSFLEGNLYAFSQKDRTFDER